LLAGVVAVSTASIFISRAQALAAPSIGIAAWRLTLATLVLAPFALTRYRADLTTLTRRDLALALAAGACLGLHFVTWITSLELTTIASSVVLVTTSPLMVALASPLVLREPLRPWMLAGVVVAIAGGMLIAVGDQGGQTGQAGSLAGDLLALCGAAAAAGYFLAGRRLRVKLALIPYVFLVYGTAALLVDVLVVVRGVQAFGFVPETYLWLALLALIPQLIGHSSFNWALRHAPATLATVPVLGEPVGATILAALVLGQIPTLLTLVGGVLVLAGVFMVTYRGARADR
jgi:drug/metabolite transporter (DMT)-like permease